MLCPVILKQNLHVGHAADEQQIGHEHDEVEKSVDESAIAILTIAVQLGFVFGTLLIAITNLSDLVNARTLFAISAILAALTNLLTI